jgi:hypothetical protein
MTTDHPRESSHGRASDPAAAHRQEHCSQGPELLFESLAAVKIGCFTITAFAGVYADIRFSYFLAHSERETENEAKATSMLKPSGICFIFNQYPVSNSERLILIDTGPAGTSDGLCPSWWKPSTRNVLSALHLAPTKTTSSQRWLHSAGDDHAGNGEYALAAFVEPHQLRGLAHDRRE